MPGKNILELAGRPLIAYSIEAARLCNRVNGVYVSSDDDRILQVSVDYGAKVIKRPAEFASDSASSFDAVEHVLEQLREQGITPENIVLLQPTSPLRNAEHVSAAINLYEESKADCLISVCEEEHHPYKSFVLSKEKKLEPLFGEEYLARPRQNLPVVYRQNGAIYIIRTSQLLAVKGFYIQGAVPFVMSSRDSVDIDTFDDFRGCERILLSH